MNRKFIAASITLALIFSLANPCLADPIPANNTKNTAFLIAVLLNYGWNLAFIGLTFKILKVRITPFFAFYVLLLTIFGLIVDALSILLAMSAKLEGLLGFLLWSIIAGLGLFFLALLLTKTTFKLDSKKSVAVGLTYGIISNPAIGFGVILPHLRAVL